MRLLTAILVLLPCLAWAGSAPILSGPARTLGEEAANKLTALDVHLALVGTGTRGAADRYLATDFRNHDLEQTPADAARTPPPGSGLRLFAITDGDLTMVALPGPADDPGARFTSRLFEVKNGRVTQMWTSGPTAAVAGAAPVDVAPGEIVGRVRVMVPDGSATRAARDGNIALVQGFITDFFVHGDTGAAARDLSPALRSHIDGVPSGSGFAPVAHKHQDRVTAPDVQTTLFALADGDLVAIGFPVPYAGDPGAWYAQNVARVRDGRIVEWWYSGFPAGHPRVAQTPD